MAAPAQHDVVEGRAARTGADEVDAAPPRFGPVGQRLEADRRLGGADRREGAAHHQVIRARREAQRHARVDGEDRPRLELDVPGDPVGPAVVREPTACPRAGREGDGVDPVALEHQPFHARVVGRVPGDGRLGGAGGAGAVDDVEVAQLGVAAQHEAAPGPGLAGSAQDARRRGQGDRRL